MKTEKKYLMYGIGLVLLTLVGVSLAYFVTEITGDSKNVSVSTGDLRIVFTDSDGSITGTDIEPDWSETKTFSVENKTNSEYKYDIVIEDLVNTFKTTGYLVYKITSTNGYNMTDYVDVPKSSTKTDTILAYSVSIASKATHIYTIEIKYINDENASQNIDMNSTLSGNIYITKGSNSDLKTAMLRDNPIVSERTDFSVTNTSDTTGTIYKTNKTEDGSEVYYYSGNTTNNWVKFGKYTSDYIIYRGYYSSTNDSYVDYETLEECNSASYYNYNCAATTIANANDDMYWRIIRTNEDGSVRLLYAGTSHDTTEGYIHSKIVFNSILNESRYVGYMYGENTSLADNRTNTTDSEIKGVIDIWYQNNLLTRYDKYTSKKAIYCNDRSIGSGTWENSGGSDFYYGAYTRLVTNKAPNYKCGTNENGGLFETTQAVEDKFSASTTGGGNGQLTYPIALMTADEVAFAGGVYDTSLSSPYAWYYNNSVGESITGYFYWWLMSPSIHYSKFSLVFNVSGSDDPGYLYDGDVGFSEAVRPVVSLSSCAQVTGTGTVADPYVIDENNSLCS